ncbi:MAG: PQQ-like beta-propeller repeat protein [Candidatus Bathyarchaeota archaeon]|nr:MAG: PQQ-like beta-propeller repeat protein [Candidatus Bathyarchaeota archaeon]
MKKKERTKIIILSLFTVLTLSTILSAFPSVSAASNVKSYPYIGAVPNPVGVNQPVLLHVGITAYLTSTEMGWEGLTITIERPDGETETLGPYRTDSTGGTGAVYTPTMVGTYTLQTHFPEQTVTLPPRGDFTYLAGTSEELELEVQDEPIAYYPGHSLPNEYWTRPIDAQLREWSEISGNWLFVPRNKYTPYNDGPRTAHILWTEPLTSGGIVGGDLGTADLEALGYHGFECGDAYEGKWGGRVRAWGSAGPIIIGGKLYYTDGPHNMPRMYYCVDIRTGEQIWAKTFLDNRSIAFGQLFYWDSFNFHGTFAYLWVTVGSDWYAFDAFTGDWMFTVENVPSGTTRWDSNGGIYRISVDQTNGLLTMWNLTASCINQGASGYGAGSWGNSVHLKTFDAAADTELAQSAWILNVTIPTGLPGRPGEYYFGDRIIGVNANTAGVSSWGLDLSSGTEGNLLFENTWDAPAEWAAGNVSIAVVSYSPSGKDGVFVVFARELREYYGFSQNTGENLWGPTDPEHYLNTFVGTESTIAYGKLISSGVSGVTSCYDVMTGALLWEYAAEDPYQEILWANSWWTKPMFVSDGLIYLAHMEHSSIDPKPRGAPFICLDMETGNEVWRADGLFRQTYWGSNAIIGDSVIATMDTYDQQIYAIGKGPSAITVDVRNDVTLGHAATIFGTVMDVSPGTKDEAIQMRFPNGVPAIADEDMSAWMKYVYKQFERPTDINGVPVKIEIVDPNNQYAWIGTATTDVYGNYAYSFRPQIEGQYMIIATFESSDAYYGSTTTTYLTVDEAPTPSTQIDTEEPIDTQTPVDAQEPTAFITSEVAIIAAVAVAAVVGVAALFVLRRRK